MLHKGHSLIKLSLVAVSAFVALSLGQPVVLAPVVPVNLLKKATRDLYFDLVKKNTETYETSLLSQPASPVIGIWVWGALHRPGIYDILGRRDGGSIRFSKEWKHFSNGCCMVTKKNTSQLLQSHRPDFINTSAAHTSLKKSQMLWHVLALQGVFSNSCFILKATAI